MITVKNYNTEINNIDWSKMPKALKEVKPDIDFGIEFYNDDPGIKETVDLFLKQLNKNVVVEKKPSKDKSSAKPKLKIGVLYDIVRTNLENQPEPQRGFIQKAEYTGFNEHTNKYVFEIDHGATSTLLSFDEETTNDFIEKKYIKKHAVKNDKTEKLYYLKTLWEGDSKYKASTVVEGGRIKQVDKLIYAGRYKESHAKRMAEIIDEDMPNIVYKFVSIKGNKVLVSSKKTTPTKKSVSKKTTKKVAKKVEKTTVERFNKEFLLIRRAYNLVSKNETVSFRKLQLLNMAFQKEIVSRGVRKSSDDAELFTKVSKKIALIFDKVKENETAKLRGVDIELIDKKLLSEMETLSKGRAVNYAVTLLRSFISVQNTKPSVDKVKRLLKRFENAISKNRIEKSNRLYKQVIDAKAELEDYIKNPKEEIEVVTYGLSAPNSRLCTNRIKCDGIGKDGKLKKGHKFNRKGEIIKTRSNKVKKKTKNLGTIVIDVSSQPTPAIAKVEGLAMAEPLVVPLKTEDTNSMSNKTDIPVVVQKELLSNAKKEGVLNSSDLMSMNFDTLELTGQWQDFMQEPAKNMKIGIIGRPKNGKTAGSTSLANELTNHGSVLYNFVDQGLNKSTQKLWELSGLSTKSNAYLTDTRDIKELEKLCASGDYDYIFIDMINNFINRTGIKPHEFEDRFIKKYSDISFVLVFESTKGGDFKGDQGWTHILDQLVYVEDFVMQSTGRYGVGHYIVWKEGLQKNNPKKYKEYFAEEIQLPETTLL